MTDAELIAGMRRELLKNILISPIVLLVRLPIGLVYAVLSGLVEALEWLGDYIPGWRLDYWHAFRKSCKYQTTLLPERPNHD